MRIQPVRNLGRTVNFRGDDAKKGTGEKPVYENPIDRQKEKELSILNCAGVSGAVGAVVAGIATCFINEASSHRYLKAGGAGIIAAAVTMALTLPSSVYNAKVKSFTREKETDVFSRDRAVKTNLLEEINKQVKNDDVPLEQKVGNYATLQMASNGAGMIVKQGV